MPGTCPSITLLLFHKYLKVFIDRKALNHLKAPCSTCHETKAAVQRILEAHTTHKTEDIHVWGCFCKTSQFELECGIVHCRGTSHFDLLIIHVQN